MEVVIKIFRGMHNAKTGPAEKRRLIRETKTWSQLSHRNIQPFLGFSEDVGPSVGLISPLCKEGTVLEYMNKHPDANRSTFVRDAADGLEYLHSKKVIHGDLHAGNCLVNDEGIVVLTDFGRARVLDQKGYTTNLMAGATQFMAPELLFKDDPDDDGTTDGNAVTTSHFKVETDVYAFGMLAFQIFTGKPPFLNTQVSTVVVRVHMGKRPVRANDTGKKITDGNWTLLQACWHEDASKRPDATAIVRRLEVSA
ncbi:hypothetical protein PLICRDRAFT_52140 [Plicaturopsis crispa FD-325 SS-3]|nr:hypothetical protein PLICRDRAFT_52140 [Plicaturopsis crispa FD-325 SS-3]